MHIARYIIVSIIGFSILFATNNRVNPRKQNYKNENLVEGIRHNIEHKKSNEKDSHDREDKVKIGPSKVEQVKNGEISLQEIFINSTETTRTELDFPEYTVCSAGCDYDDLATAINNVPDSSTVFISEPGTYHISGIELEDKSIWVRGLSPEETILTGEGILDENVIYFEKEDYADWSLAENQDRITNDIWITRGNNMPIFNAAVESYDDWDDTDLIPTGTLWAQGRTAEVDSSDYQPFRPMTDHCPPCILNQPLALKTQSLDYEAPDSVVFFEKANYADWTLPENQDRIADSVWITRGNNMPIFNAAVESYDNWDDTDLIPTGTLWAQGRTANVDSSDYQPFIPMTDFCPPCILDEVLSLKLPSAGPDSSDIYYDVVFISWTEDNNGGGFAYYRGAPGAYLPVDADTIENFYDVVFTKWTEDNNGGGFAYYRGEPGADLPIGGSMFTISDGSNNQEYVYFKLSDLTITNGSGSGESAGGIDIDSDTWTTIDGPTFELENIVATNHSNGFFSSRTGGNGIQLIISNSIIDNNSRNLSGGAFNLLSGNTSITNSSFTNNQSNGDGGVIYSNDGNITIINSEFSNNSAEDRGGVIASDEGDFIISTSSFTSNHSDYIGGVIYSVDIFDFILYQNQFDNNTADYGGAIYVWDQALGYFYETSFTQNNSFDNGGAIYFHNGQMNFDIDIDFVNTEFINNSAGSHGGAIFSKNYYDARLSFNSSLFEGNTSNDDGGAIFFGDDGELRIENSTFIHNECVDDGGAVYNEGANSPGMVVINSVFAENEAGDNGGAIYNMDHLYIYNSTIVHNRANSYYGGLNFLNEMSSSILAQNEVPFDSTNFYPDAGEIYSSGNNLIGDIGHGTLTRSEGTEQYDIVGNPDSLGILPSEGIHVFDEAVNPQLAFVEDDGHLPYYIPYSGSPVIDWGRNWYVLEGEEFTLSTDLRGLPRQWLGSADAGAIERHPGDAHDNQTAPNAVTDLTAIQNLDGGIQLNWTATGANGNEGTASNYTLFYHTESFTSTTDEGVTSVDIDLAPSVSGSSEEYILQNLEYGSEYYIGLIVHDEIGQSSDLSNIVNSTTLGAPNAQLSDAALSITLPANAAVTRHVTLSNIGEANLSFSSIMDFGDYQNTEIILARGAGGATANMYSYNLNSGILETLPTLSGITHLTGIAKHPISQVWYGSQSSGGLFTFEPGEESTTSIGNHTTSGNIPDIDFSPDGTLYAWSEGCDCLTTIDIETAQANEYGLEVSSWMTGLAVDDAGQAYMKAGDEFHWIDIETGESTNMITLDDEPYNLLDIGPNGEFYSGIRYNNDFVLVTIDTSTGALDTVDTFYGLPSIAALSVTDNSWATIGTRSGTIAGGELLTLAIEFNTNGMDDSTYVGTVYIETNDPEQPQLEVQLTLTVTSSGDVPVLVTESLPAAVEDEAYSFQLEGFAGNGNDISYTLNSGPDWLQLSETGELTGTPENSHVGGPFDVSFTLSDSVSAIDATLSISVDNINDAPYVLEGLADIEIDEDSETVEIDLSPVFGDDDVAIDMDSLTYSIQGYLTFRKMNNADWTLEENQDRVNDDVWITRGNNQSIFNIAQETEFSEANGSPIGTEWSFGYAAHASGLTFEPFKAAVNNSPPNAIGKPLVLHTINDDQYYDMMIHQWTGGGSGGGFAWTRTTPNNNESPVVTPEINGSMLVLHMHPDAYGNLELVIVATDESGLYAMDSVHISVNPVNDAPSTVELVAPLNHSIQTDLTPSFHWTVATDTDLEDVVDYQMTWWRVNNQDNAHSVTTDSNGITLQADIMDNATFNWTVDAADMNGASTPSDTFLFHTDAFPEPPLNFATVWPIDESTGIDSEVEFIWNSTSDPDPLDQVSYQIVYATDWQDSSTYQFSEITQDTSLTLVLEDNVLYYWGVIAMDNDEFVVGSNDNTPHSFVVGTLEIDDQLTPDVFALHQNFPNPFNPVTTIRYDVPVESNVHIQIFDILGRKVLTLVNEYQTPGFKSVVWDALDQHGSPVGAGVYFYIIDAGSFHQTKKMILLK